MYRYHTGPPCVQLTTLAHPKPTPKEQAKWLAQVHNCVVGHHGVERTLDKLKRLLADKGIEPWPKMRQSVVRWCKQCNYCQMASYVKPRIVPPRYTLGQKAPMVLLNVDTIGPVPADEHGNKYILVLVDACTRFVELFPTKDTTAESAAAALLAHAGRYGFPKHIKSDNGPQFSNKICTELSKLLGSEQLFSTPYSSEENAIVERVNSEVGRHLRAIIFDTRVQRQWAMNQLPLVQRIINAAVHSSTGFSPAQMLFGNAINLDRGVLLEHPPVSDSDQGEPISEYMEKLLAAQSVILDAAQRHQSELDEFHISERTLRAPDNTRPIERTVFPVNSYVLRLQPTGQRPDKFAHHWTGPFRVVRNDIDDKGTYVIQHVLTGRTANAHVSQLKQFLFDSDEPDSPLEAAMHAESEFAIEDILAHTGKARQRKKMQFLVKWRGYPGQDSWEPYKSLLGTEKLDAYAYNNKLKALLPRNYKPPVV